mgnify:CR=1 FL=1
MAQTAADGMWREMGCRSREQARGFRVAHYRRRWGVCVVREFARHRIKRVPWVGATRQGGAAMQATGDGEDRQALAGARQSVSYH